VVLAAAPAQEAVAEEAHKAALVHVADDGDLSFEFFLTGHGASTVDVDPLDGDGRAIIEVPSKDLGRAAAPYHAPEVRVAAPRHQHQEGNFGAKG